jgi:hypothetical protein
VPSGAWDVAVGPVMLRSVQWALLALIAIAWLWRDSRVQMAVVAVFIALYTYYAATYIPQL